MRICHVAITTLKAAAATKRRKREFLLTSHLEKECLEDATVLPLLLLNHGVKEVPGIDPLVGQPLRPTHKPNENVGHAVLGLKNRATCVIRWR